MRPLKINISPGAYIATAVGILLLPLDLLIAAVLAALIHELFHLLALRFAGATVAELKIGLFGAKISTGVLSVQQELLCAAAGPLGSLSLLLLARWAPLLAFFGLCQGLFNLLPIYPLDGGRIVRAFICLLMEKSSEQKNSLQR